MKTIDRYYDNVMKVFAAACEVYSVAIVTYMFFDKNAVDAYFLFGAAVFCVAVFLYMGPHNDILIRKQEEDEEAAGGIIM
jgi:hypothetical protein